MSGFIRVRAVDGPKHEFDAPVGEVDAHPDLYEVIDAEISPVAREATYIVEEVVGLPLENLKRSELDDLARGLGIDPTTAKNKPDLVALINASPRVPVLTGTENGDIADPPPPAATEPAGTADKEKN